MIKAKSDGPFLHKTVILPPDGEYRGLWGGYVVEMDMSGQKVEFRTNDGVRGMNIPVRVVVKDGSAEVFTEET